MLIGSVYSDERRRLPGKRFLYYDTGKSMLKKDWFHRKPECIMMCWHMRSLIGRVRIKVA